MGVALLLAPVVLLVLQNLFINLALRPILNRRPERFHLDFKVAWSLIPGQVQVRDLEIRNQSGQDQWLITAERASGTIFLQELTERRFHARDLRAFGLSLRYRRRLDAEATAAAAAAEAAPAAATAEPAVAEAAPEVAKVDPAVAAVDPTAPAARVEASKEPPIAGLTNPPYPNPDMLYPGPRVRWQVRLDDVQVEHVNEIWVSDYRLTGDADLSADLNIADPYMDVETAIFVHRMRADIGDTPVAQNIHGEVQLLVDSMDRKASGPERVQAITARAQLGVDVQELRFLDFYLGGVPWLAISGGGHANVDVALAEGRFAQGSQFQAYFPELLVRVVGDDISGAGTIQAEVGQGPDGEPQSRLAVDFDDFAILPDGSSDPLAEGTGFHIGAESPDVSLNEPYTSVSVTVDLPESRIPDFALYNAFLPTDVGLSLRQGSGTVHGHMQASSLDNHASGDVFFTGDEVAVQTDSLVITGDLAVHGRLADADLAAGRYDLSGSSIELTHAGLVNHAHADTRNGGRRWYASLSVPSGAVLVGAPIYLDANVRLKCKDSVPFVVMFADAKGVPRAVQDLLSVQNVSGQARLQLGKNTLAVSSCRIRSGEGYQVDLRYFRNGASGHGDLLATVGPLAVGIGLSPSGPTVHLIGAERWFHHPSP